MAALIAARNIYHKGPESTATSPLITIQMKAGAKCFQGGLVGTDATGYGVSGAAVAATGVKIWGIALKSVDNTSGASGATSVDVQRGIFPFAAFSGDAPTIASMGLPVYASDDQTVRVTATGLSAAGIFYGFGDAGEPLVQVGNFSQTGV